jgi:uncharacterized ferritin-like protein (DUF455 family)
MSVMFDDEKPEAYHWRMNTETRIEKLEADEADLKVDIARWQTSHATKDDIAELKIMFAQLESRFSETAIKLEAEGKAQISETKALIAQAKTSVIAWSLTAIFLAQLLPALLKLFLPN